jgi:uncharacterized glyoxalase superfamily protein PhnB
LSRLYPCLYYDDAPAAIEFLCRAFGFKRRLVVPGEHGTVLHAELSLGDDVIMVGSASAAKARISPRGVAGLHQALCVRVDDPDAHYARSLAAGAQLERALQDEEYGSRGYMVRDPEGQSWYFGTYLPGAHWTE